MGTTSEKLTYLNVTKQKLKQAINNIGGEVTDETTFRNYVAELENAYDRLPKTEFEEGESVTLENTLKGKLDFQDGKVGFGQTEQDSTTGKQLFNKDIAPSEEWLATVSTLDTGIRATHNGGGNNSAIRYKLIDLLGYEGKVVRIKTHAKSGGSNPGMVYLRIAGESTSVYTPYTAQVSSTTTDGDLSVTYTIPSTLDSVAHYLWVAFYGTREYSASAGVYVDYTDAIVTIDNADMTYEPYTGGYSSPSPNWEQQVKCVAGRNIWGGIGTFNNANLAKTNADGTIDINITNTAITSAVTSQAVSFGLTKVLKRGTYTFTAENLISNMFCQIIKVNSETSGEVFKIISTSTKSQTFTITEDMTYFVRVQAEEGTTFNGTIKPMICEGTTQRPYLPYNTIEEVVSGKNKLNFSDVTLESNGITLQIKDNYFILNGTNNGTESAWNISYYMTPFKTNANTKLKAFQISGTSSGTSQNTLLRTYYNWQEQVNVNFKGTTISSYSEELTYNQSIFSLTGGTYNDYKIAFMVADNLTDSDTYEPYITPTSYQLSLGDRKVFDGDYLWIDRTTGKKYHHHASTKYDFTGQEGASSMGWTDKGAWRVTIPNLKQTTELTDLPNVLCNKLKADTQNNVFSGGAYGIANARNSSDVIIRNDDLISYTTQQVVSWLSTNAVYLVHKLATETDEEITGTLAEQLEAWWNGQSLDGTTIIEGNGDLPLLIEVRALKAS